jgi:asparagine synthase (glutamine-hydrolysing)
VSTQKVRTFNVSFGESEFSESKYARLIAGKYNTVHHEILLTPADFLSTLPEALRAMDHPSGDGPNTFVVAKATRNAGITMALSGIGGDELFAGYPVFRQMSAIRNRAWLNAFPTLLRKPLAGLVRLTKRTTSANKMAELLSQDNINVKSAYPLVRSLFTADELRTLSRHEFAGNPVSEIIAAIKPEAENLLSAVSRMEIQTYLQNVLLRDTDQMAMAVALEVREPFLDYHLVEYVLSVPDKFKYPHSPKKLLVDSLGDLIPPEIVNRPKMGFTLPWANWMKGELKSFCEHELAEFGERGYCNKDELNQLWKRFLNGDSLVQWSRLWHIVVLNNWIRVNMHS